VPIRLPPVELTCSSGGSSRILNGSNQTGPNDWADGVTFGSIMPGGFSGMDFRIPDAARLATPGVFKYGANVRGKIAPGEAGAGTILWEGYLKTPTPNGDGTATMHAAGYKTLLEERSDPLLWQTRYYGDWQSPDTDDFSDNFHNSQHIDASVQDASLKWVAQKGTDIADGNKAMLLWWGGGNDASVDKAVFARCGRIAGALIGSDDNGNQTNARFSMHLERFTGPISAGTPTDVYVFWNEMNSKDRSTFDITLGAGVGGPASLIGFTLYKKGPVNNNSLDKTWRFWIENLRVNDIASGDSYTASAMVNDLKDRLGFGNAYITATSQNVLPLWWQQGTWSDLMDYLAGSEGNWKWGVWERGAQGPIIEFRDWGTNFNTWKVWGYPGSGQANAVDVQIAPSEDVYSVVDVTYKQGSTSRIRHSRKNVSPNPFAGLDPPLALRQRTYQFALPDIQLDGTFADNVATKLANDLGTERLGGTMRISFAQDAVTGNDKSSYQVKAGDKVTLVDYPGGSQVFRITEAQHDPEGTTLTLGPRSLRVERMIWWVTMKQKREGRAASAP
jgi:hypothetical protein